MCPSTQSASKNRPEDRIVFAAGLMERFAERTGLLSEREGKRYLWTDAFAVCNYLGLAHWPDDRERSLELARRLIEQVHDTLGRHRSDDSRRGRLSGLSEEEARRHPTIGGLRIGKQLPERAPDQPFDERLEWDRDGQYFHYLIKWMHALDQVSRTTGEALYNRWARELARVAFDRFVADQRVASTRGGAPRIYWKMSIDLSRPLVASTGHHDPLDGLITFRQLEATAGQLGETEDYGLSDSADLFGTMIEGTDLATLDPLGLGGLLTDAYRVAQLVTQGSAIDQALLARLLDAARRGLEASSARYDFALPAAARLGFRELGLAIGLQAISPLAQLARSSSKALRSEVAPALARDLDALTRYSPLAEIIQAFWLEPAHRRAESWIDHRDINDVMLATALAPAGFLKLERPGS